MLVLLQPADYILLVKVLLLLLEGLLMTVEVWGGAFGCRCAGFVLCRPVHCRMVTVVLFQLFQPKACLLWAFLIDKLRVTVLAIGSDLLYSLGICPLPNIIVKWLIFIFVLLLVVGEDVAQFLYWLDFDELDELVFGGEFETSLHGRSCDDRVGLRYQWGVGKLITL